MDEQSIFLNALEKTSPTERSTYLDSACAGDAALRKRVEQLLSRQSDVGSFLESPVRAPTGTEQSPEHQHEQAREAAADLAGAGSIPLDFLAPSEKPECLGTLGQYEILSVVGRGGMGVVLKARDTSLQRIVAIKVLTPELAADAVARQRFLREARAAAAVVDPHIVTIHAVDDSQSPHLVMEMVDGKTLEEKIRTVGMLGPREVARIGCQAALGLAAAHKQGVIHRDVKPANILLENGVERVKIADFGLARACDDVGVTKTGEINGTPQFMSPEQAEGAAVDPRSDLFSLGAVLYTMCTGHPPFRGDSLLGVLRHVVAATPRPIRESNRDIPPCLCDVIDKLMSKRKEDRFQSATELATRLENELVSMQGGAVPEMELTAARHDPTDEKIGSQPKPKRRWWVAAVLVLLCTAVMLPGIAMLVSGSGEDQPQEEVATRSPASLEGSADEQPAEQPPIVLEDDSDFGKPPTSMDSPGADDKRESPAPADEAPQGAPTTRSDQARAQMRAVTAEVDRRVADGAFGDPVDIQQLEEFIQSELDRRKREGLIPSRATIQLKVNSRGQVNGHWIWFGSPTRTNAQE